jgi:hypothetical protein
MRKIAVNLCVFIVFEKKILITKYKNYDKGNVKWDY